MIIGPDGLDDKNHGRTPAIGPRVSGSDRLMKTAPTTRTAGPSGQPPRDTPAATFVWLKASGFAPIAIYAPGMKRGRDASPNDLTKGKEPMGSKWGLRDWTLEDFGREDRRCRDQVGREAGVGLCLGPGRGPDGTWPIDVEGDGPEAEESRHKLFGGEEVETLGWSSHRGGHQIFLLDSERMAAIIPGLSSFEVKNTSSPGVFKLPALPGLELRLGGWKADGTIKQAQSVVPPTPGEDGVPRRWYGALVAAPAPEAFYQVLANLTPRSQSPAGPSKPEPRRRDAVVGGAIRRYALAALERQVKEMEAALPAHRNDAINIAAYAMGRFVGAGALDRSSVEYCLSQAAIRMGKAGAESERTIQSGLDAGIAQPRDLSEVGSVAGPGSGSDRRTKEGHHPTTLTTLTTKGGRGANVVNVVNVVPQESSEESVDEPPIVVRDWPAPLEPAAHYGLIGDIVRCIAPHTEADVAGLTFMFLTAIGNLIGRTAHFTINRTNHFTNLFMVAVGRTSTGRKGTALDIVQDVVKEADATWIGRCVSGMVSGEGLIWGVRVPIYRREKEQGEYKEVLTDPGVTDKRLFVVESEFGGTLKVTSREGNNLSSVVRQAWDSGTLRSLVKNSPGHATNAHISILANITDNEAIRHLSNLEATNGFANRFLWVAVRRSRLLPDGSIIETKLVKELARKIGEIKIWMGDKPVQMERERRRRSSLAQSLSGSNGGSSWSARFDHRARSASSSSPGHHLRGP